MEYLPISIKDSNGSLHKLPYPTAAKQPTFCWELPAGVVQAGYCLELKSRFPTTLSNGQYGFAYYNSSLVESTSQEHFVNFEMFTNVWAGLIEVRLRIYDVNKHLIYSTHDESEYQYPFETIPQGFAWDSTYDGYYYLLDDVVEQISGVMEPVFQWRSVSDEDLQDVSYQLQWSLTPLFLDGVFGQLGLSNTRTVDAQGRSSLHTTFTTVVNIKAPVFYRVRAFDGLDYSDWSHVNGFYCNPSSAPFCVFNSVESNCSTTEPNVLQRPNGEVEISFRVVDLDTDTVTAYLLYKLNGVEYPCSLNCSTVSIPANKDMIVSWQSARQLPNENVTVHLYLYAYDGSSQSDKIVWENPVIINNTGIGFGYNDGTNDRMEYRFAGVTRNYERYIQIPKEKAQVVTVDGSAVYRPKNIPEKVQDANRFNWAYYWANKLGNELSKYHYTIGERLIYGFIGFERRPTWNIYDGYDSDVERLEKSELYLEFKDDFENREKGENERFTIYFKNPELGRGTGSITYFLKPAEFGRGFSIHRPAIVKAGTLGLYFDGAGLNNKSSDYFGSFDPPDKEGIEKLLKAEIWKKFYQLDPMFCPDVKPESTILGPIDYKRYDEYNYWYWTLFEYCLEINFPFYVEKGKNDRFAYRFNGVTYEGSILEEGEEKCYFAYLTEISSKLLVILNKLFPQTIFQPIDSITISIEKYNVKVYSKWTDFNKSFQFVPIENNCYALFGIDLNLRYSQRSRSTGTEGNYVVYNPTKESKTSAVYEIECDTGDCIGQEGEINSTEPLFTCDPIHLNQYGCHYKYTPNRFRLSGKIYIRKYIVKPVYATTSSEPLREAFANETSVPIKGYRNYCLKYVGANALDEPLFEKEFQNSIGGTPALCKTITVSFEGRELEDLGYWEAGKDINDPTLCVSHEYDEEKGIYTRKNPSAYLSKIGIKDCYCTEYVELNEGWEKPFFGNDQGIGKINKLQPVRHNGEVIKNEGYIQYLMGAYKPPVNQSVEISSYDNNFTSAVETETGYNLNRYQTYWNDNSPEKQGIVVDPVFMKFECNERYTEKWGYVPNLSLQKYFKKDDDNVWQGRVIPPNNGYVHDIYEDEAISFPSYNKVHLFRQVLSDTHKIEVPEDEGMKLSDINFRIKTTNPYEIKDYYSAMPQTESEAYINRPPAIYDEDRPTRISGFIDAMNTIVTWKFLYLQTEWNNYNLIHWEGSQDENVYAKIEVAEVDENNRPGSFMSLKTKNAQWFSKYSSWLIPYVKLKQSDYIDTLNGTFTSIQDGLKIEHSFENNHRYMFRICGLNINSGTANNPVFSTIFTYSQDAYSPPVITSVEYEKWSHEFEIEFRFDDARGRKYDIINFYYVAYDPNSPSPPDAQFIQLGTEVLKGNLLDLESNVVGDNVISESYLKKHKVYFSSDNLSGVEGKNIRFRLEGIASEDREGMTAPVFHFRMWANEFLKKADDNIDKILGKKNRWVYDISVNDEGETIEQWKYLPAEKAIIMPGILSEQNNVISKINDKFESWYLTVAKFEHPSFDARYNHLCIQEDEGELYSSCFNVFVEQYNLLEDWEEYKLNHKGKQESYLEPLFIAQNGYTEDFNFFWDNKASSLIQSLSSFENWFEDNKILSREEAKPLFINEYGYTSSYQKYLTDNTLTDNDDSVSDFMAENSLQSEFDRYFILVNNYPDGRFNDRKSFVNENHQEAFETWQNAPVDAYGDAIDAPLLANDDDLYRQFIASDRNIWNEMAYTNQGKGNAKRYFLSSTENGVSYGQQIQTANNEIIAAQKTLNEAYTTRNYYESVHRRKLIAKGYFSNGWKNNQAYLGNKSKNEVFRFRVENQPTSGTRATETPEVDFGTTTPDIVSPIAGYDTRWDIFFHFQLDFYDSFDSQNGKPLRDYMWQRLDCSGYSGSGYDATQIDGVSYIRIMGAIEADSGMHVLPNSNYTPSNTNSPSTNDPYSFQFAGRFSIPKSELPGELEDNTVIPEYWSKNEDSNADDFNQLYFWRVCPYNVVKRPIFDREHCQVKSIELFGALEWSNNKYWKTRVTNSFFGNHKYSLLASDYDIYYVWVATSECTPVWQLDVNSACWNEFEAYYANYFMGTDDQRMDLEYTENPLRESYQGRLERGEIVFLTDRPREYVNNALQYVEDDSTDHFKSLWIPFNTKRSKPWMWYDEDEKCWFMIYQKLSKNYSGYSENVFILARGLSPQTFGEECQLFPTSTMDNAGSVITGALSFETPRLVKNNGIYELLFRVRKDNSTFELWKANSSNLYDWNDFNQINFDQGTMVSDFSIYFENDVYTLYATTGTVINKYTSVNGIDFTFVNQIYSDMYALSSPTLYAGRVYFGITLGERGKILSIDENGEYDTLRVEKGSAVNFENAITFNAADFYFSPMIFEDFDKGTKIARLIYEKPASVYVYNDGVMSELQIMETAFFTEYLECYNWTKTTLNDWYWTDDFYGSRIYINGNYYPIIKDSDGNKVSINNETSYIPVGDLEILVRSETMPLQVKIPFYQEGTEEIESEGEWLDYRNVGKTTAWLSPEETPEDYNPNDYTMGLFMAEHNLTAAYETWKLENYPTFELSNEEQYQMEFLLQCKQYSVYLKWSKKGPGLYRYLNAVKRSSYTGDGSNV